jgi:predicted aldo/keto reductase-like oxidoreductase
MAGARRASSARELLNRLRHAAAQDLAARVVEMVGGGGRVDAESAVRELFKKMPPVEMAAWAVIVDRAAAACGAGPVDAVETPRQ